MRPLSVGVLPKSRVSACRLFVSWTMLPFFLHLMPVFVVLTPDGSLSLRIASNKSSLNGLEGKAFTFGLAFLAFFEFLDFFVVLVVLLVLLLLLMRMLYRTDRLHAHGEKD